MKGLFIGLTGIDYVYYLDSFPEENNKCKTNDYSKYIGGPAANAAITYAAMGGDATLITALGCSAEGKAVEKELTSLGVKVINVAKDNKLPGISTICVSKDGKRTIISGQNCFEEIDLSQLELSEYEFALLDCNQQDVSLPLLDKLVCPIVLDAGSYKPNIEKYLEKATIVISSENFRDEQGNDIFSMPFDNIELRAMTRGEKSILTAKGEIEVEQVQCIDSLAAGDIFHGVFCYVYFERDCTFEIALKYGAAAATESVKYRGPREWMDKI